MVAVVLKRLQRKELACVCSGLGQKHLYKQHLQEGAARHSTDTKLTIRRPFLRFSLPSSGSLWTKGKVQQKLGSEKQVSFIIGLLKL